MPEIVLAPPKHPSRHADCHCLPAAGHRGSLQWPAVQTQRQSLSGVAAHARDNGGCPGFAVPRKAQAAGCGPQDATGAILQLAHPSPWAGVFLGVLPESFTAKGNHQPALKQVPQGPVGQQIHARPGLIQSRRGRRGRVSGRCRRSRRRVRGQRCALTA